MAITEHKGALLQQAETLGAVSVASKTSSTIVFNKDAKTPTGIGPTGEDSPVNPYGILTEAVTEADKVIVVNAPPGANFLDLCVEHTSGAPLSTNAVVRVFGEVPPKPEWGTDGARASWPVDYNAGFFNPGNGRNQTDWKPLFTSNTRAFSITLGAATPSIAEDNGTTARTEVATVALAGSSRVIVTIETEATGTASAMVVGWFGA